MNEECQINFERKNKTRYCDVEIEFLQDKKALFGMIWLENMNYKVIFK